MNSGGKTFERLSEELGGFNPASVESFFYLNNPFQLHHWTMNIVEVLLCIGAVLAFVHAFKVLRSTGNPVNLSFCVISIGYVFAAEIPIYFPELIGGDPSSLYFAHNEFSVGLVYARTPLYIVALYPALTYPCYVLVERTGVFHRRWGLILGAVSVGFFHHCFYEIFDQFGPQYSWWLWNYDRFNATVASVPLASIFTFSFVGPLSLTLVTRFFISRYVQKCMASGARVKNWYLASLCVVGSVAVLFPAVLTAPDTYYQIFLESPPSPKTEKIVSFSLLTLAAIATFSTLFSVPGRKSGKGIEGENTIGCYPMNFLVAYLLVFAGLWMYALPEYLSTDNGVTARGTYTGSLAYVLGCFAIALLLLCLCNGRRSEHS